MKAYGFEWLTTILDSLKILANTPWQGSTVDAIDFAARYVVLSQKLVLWVAWNSISNPHLPFPPQTGIWHIPMGELCSYSISVNPLRSSATLCVHYIFSWASKKIPLDSTQLVFVESYKGELDWVFSGRSYFSDLSDFGIKHLHKELNSLNDTGLLRGNLLAKLNNIQAGINSGSNG